MSDEILPLIKQSPLLGALGDREAQQVASVATVRTFDAGDVIIEEGSDTGLAMWVVVDGEVEVRKGDTVVTSFGRGAHIGEVAVLADQGKPRTAGVYAKTETRAFRLAKWDLVPMVENNPAVAMAVITELARRLENTTAQLDALS